MASRESGRHSGIVGRWLQRLGWFSRLRGLQNDQGGRFQEQPEYV